MEEVVLGQCPGRAGLLQIPVSAADHHVVRSFASPYTLTLPTLRRQSWRTAKDIAGTKVISILPGVHSLSLPVSLFLSLFVIAQASLTLLYTGCWSLSPDPATSTYQVLA